MATTPYDDSPPTIAERYSIATGTADLTGFGGMIPQGSGSRHQELLMAAAMADSVLGACILRLLGEWGNAAKPARPGPRLLKALSWYIRREDQDAQDEAMRTGKAWKSPGDPAVRAITRAGEWYTGELLLLAQSLRTKAETVRLLNEWAAIKGIRPQAVAEGVMLYLDATCPSCHGHGDRRIHGQHTRQCHPCGATGNRHRSEEVGRVIRHIEYCIGVAQGSIKTRLA